MIGFVVGLVVGFGLGGYYVTRCESTSPMIRSYDDWLRVREYVKHLHDGEPIERKGES